MLSLDMRFIYKSFWTFLTFRDQVYLKMKRLECLEDNQRFRSMSFKHIIKESNNCRLETSCSPSTSWLSNFYLHIHLRNSKKLWGCRILHIKLTSQNSILINLISLYSIDCTLFSECLLALIAEGTLEISSQYTPHCISPFSLSFSLLFSHSRPLWFNAVS